MDDNSFTCLTLMRCNLLNGVDRLYRYGGGGKIYYCVGDYILRKISGRVCSFSWFSKIYGLIGDRYHRYNIGDIYDKSYRPSIISRYIDGKDEMVDIRFNVREFNDERRNMNSIYYLCDKISLYNRFNSIYIELKYIKNCVCIRNFYDKLISRDKIDEDNGTCSNKVKYNIIGKNFLLDDIDKYLNACSILNMDRIVEVIYGINNKN